MSRCETVGTDGTKRLPYRCVLEAGHAGDHDMQIDPTVTRDEAQVRPQHYKMRIRGTVPSVEGLVTVECEAIDVVEALGFEDDAYLTTALIYLLRLGRKDAPRVEIKKAIWWLNRWLQREEETTR